MKNKSLGARIAGFFSSSDPDLPDEVKPVGDIRQARRLSNRVARTESHLCSELSRLEQAMKKERTQS